ncbi:hypothetical protein SBF1_360002 [Candidatus Desulfosporosinus infrequens]|uniref:Uncharacterized protein n=1 Tax=Candidatus Desulfosporosinus infrequens TaxID=2043169 RepID=A0A2U3L3I9_9FIRM|nr:hypothetical protein SBF1_360002 [Candidatus Desulfosporosinus infrequens]
MRKGRIPTAFSMSKHKFYLKWPIARFVWKGNQKITRIDHSQIKQIWLDSGGCNGRGNRFTAIFGGLTKTLGNRCDPTADCGTH